METKAPQEAQNETKITLKACEMSWSTTEASGYVLKKHFSWAEENNHIYSNYSYVVPFLSVPLYNHHIYLQRHSSYFTCAFGYADERGGQTKAVNVARKLIPKT